MLVASVILYFVVTIAIGLWAARRVHNSKDFLVAGRSSISPATCRYACVLFLIFFFTIYILILFF
jgi:Na+/proline symporter